jgi:hypothetical protein
MATPGNLEMAGSHSATLDDECAPLLLGKKQPKVKNQISQPFLTIILTFMIIKDD